MDIKLFILVVHVLRDKMMKLLSFPTNTVLAKLVCVCLLTVFGNTSLVGGLPTTAIVLVGGTY